MRISVVTAVFNNASTIRSALESTLSQSFDDVELVVVDGGSTDGTKEILQEYRDRVGVLVSEPDDGIYDALNKGVGLASGDVIGFLHSDDLFADDASLWRVAACLEDPLVEGCYGDLCYVRHGEPRTVVRHWQAGVFEPEMLARGWMPPHPTLYVRRSVFESVGRFDTTLRIAADYDWMLRLLLAGHRLAYIPQVQVRMRTGGASNRSVGNIMRKSGEDFAALRRNGFSVAGATTTLMAKNLRKLPQLVRRR